MIDIGGFFWQTSLRFPKRSMAELIQFNCPACSTLLRLPLAMAAQQGPCPTCRREITAPDPYRGIGAQLLAIPVPPKVIEPFRPFVDPPAAKVEPQPAATPLPSPPPPTPAREATQPRPPQAPTRCASFQWAVLLLSSALALLAGFVIGYYWHQRLTETKPAEPAPKVEAAPLTPTEPVDPVPVRVKPFIEEPIKEQKPEPEPKPEKPEPSKVSAAAEATLQAFLEAPDWAARSAYVLFPEKIRTTMEAYSREVPDGPTPFKSISVKQSHLDENSGYTLLIFFVKTEKFPDGIPVAVQETASGWLVDWQAFVEFRDGLFQKFVNGPTDQTGRFHLMVSPLPPERAAKNENEHFSSFALRSPLDPTPQTAYVKKSSEIFTTFQAATEGGAPFTPVLELTKRTTSDGKTYLEVVNLISTNWLPAAE